MESRKQIAVEKKHCGLNCAQAVLCTYADLAGIDEETAIRIAYPVWTGIGAVGAVLLGIFVFHEPATFWRVFFLSTLILSIVGLKIVR